MVRSVRAFPACAVTTALAVIAPVQAAITIDFNSSSGYVDGQLIGQNDPVGAAWAAGSPSALDWIKVVNTGTDGKASGVTNPSGTPPSNSDVVLTLPTAVGPGPLGHQVSFDLTQAGASGFTWKLIFKDAAGSEMARIDMQSALGRGRGPGGVGIVTSGMTLAAGQTRTMFVVFQDFAGTKKALFYQDSVAPANQLLNAGDPDGGIVYTSTTNAIKSITFQTFQANQQGALVDNITLVPEPTSLALLGIATLGLFQRRRRVA